MKYIFEIAVNCDIEMRIPIARKIFFNLKIISIKIILLHINYIKKTTLVIKRLDK